MDDPLYVMVNGRRKSRRQMWGKNGSEQFINGTTISLHQSYGCNQNISHGNCYLSDEETLIYICGIHKSRHIIKYEVGKRKQSFIQKMLDEDEVISMTQSSNVKGVLSIAVAIKNTTLKSPPLVRVYKSNRKNAKYLLTLTRTESIYQISLFKTNSEKLLTYNDVGQQVSQLFGHCYSHSSFGVIGPNYLKIWEFNEDEKNFEFGDVNFQLLDESKEEFVQAVCLEKNDYHAALTNTGDILLYKKKAQLQRLQIELTQQDLSDTITRNELGKNGQTPSPGRMKGSVPKGFNYNAVIMAPTSLGLVVGYSSINLLSVYDLQKDQRLHFKKHYKFNVPHFYRVVSLHVGSEDTYIAMTIQHQQKQINNLFDPQSQVFDEDVGEIKLMPMETPAMQRKTYEKDPVINNLEIYLFNYGIVDVINTALRDPFECLFSQGVHKGKVIDIEFSPSKSVITTLSEDKQVKVWEFQYQRGDFKCIQSITLHENPACITLHPMTFQCAIGYREGLKIYFVLEDDLKQVHFENLKQCTAAKYSQGGNYLAVGNQSQINIYNPYSYQLMHTLTGHLGLINYINWINGDQMITSNCTQGLVLCFDVQSNARHVDHSFKAHKALCSVYDDVYDLLIGSYGDQKVRIFNEKGVNLFYEMDVYPQAYTCVYLAKFLDTILFGTSQGSIRAYLWPFTNFQMKQQEYVETALHQGAVSMIRVTPDLGYLVSGSDDGSIYVSTIKVFRDGLEISATDMISKDLERTNFSITNLYCFNQLTFVSRANQDNKRDQVKELEFRISNLKTDIDDEKEKIIQHYKGQIKVMEDKKYHDIALQKEFLSSIMEESDLNYKNLENSLDQMRSNHNTQVDCMDTETNTSLLKLYQKSDNLNEFRVKSSEKMKHDVQFIKQDYVRVLQEIDGDFNQKYGELFDRFQMSQENMKLDERKFKEVFIQSEREFEILLNSTKKQLIEELDKSQHRSEDLRSSNTKFTKECERFTQRKMELESLIKETQTQIDHLRTERTNFEGKNTEMVVQLKDKEDRINMKEQEIKNYRNKNHHLQNFRAVYDYRVNTLIDEKQPLQDHLVQLEVNVKVMYKELIEESEAQKKINDNLNDTHHLIQKLKDSFRSKKDLLFKSRSQLIALQYDILQVLKQNQIDYFPQMLQKVHKNHFLMGSQRVQEPVKIGNQDVTSQQTDEFLIEMEKNTQQAIKEELLRQRDFLSKKIQAVSKLNKQNEEDRDDLILRVQNENTNLIRECNTLRAEKRGLKEHCGNIQKANDILNKEIISLGSNLNELDQSEVQNITTYTQELDFMNDNNQSSLRSPQLEKTTKSSKKLLRPTGFQRYHEEKQEKDLKRYKLTQSLPRFKQLAPKEPQENKELLLNLLREIQQFGMQENQDDIVCKLKEQVQSFIKSEESNVIFPNITKRYNNSQMISQEETQLVMGEISGANTSIESKLKNSFQLKKVQGISSKQTLPTLKQPI